MSRKISCSVYVLLLFISMNIYSITTKSNLSSNSKGGLDTGKLQSICLKGLTDNMPPDFCWKKGADVGVIPTACPAGWFRFLALCYQNCRSGYNFVIGVCWGGCEAGYANHPASCYKNLFRWYFKHSYIPSSMTNFDSRVPCPAGMYRGAALCYRDCNKIGLLNCGIGACSGSSAKCAETILNMVRDVFTGIASAVSFVGSFGASSAATMGAKAAIKTGVKALGKAGLKSALNTVKKAIKGQFKDLIIGKAKEYAKGVLKDKAKEIFGISTPSFDIGAFCDQVFKNAADKADKTEEVSENSLVNAVDIFGVKGMVTSCKDTSSTNSAIECAKSVMDGASSIDPTGILTVAAAFMKPVCDV